MRMEPSIINSCSADEVSKQPLETYTNQLAKIPSGMCQKDRAFPRPAAIDYDYPPAQAVLLFHGNANLVIPASE